MKIFLHNVIGLDINCPRFGMKLRRLSLILVIALCINFVLSIFFGSLLPVQVINAIVAVCTLAYAIYFFLKIKAFNRKHS